MKWYVYHNDKNYLVVLRFSFVKYRTTFLKFYKHSDTPSPSKTIKNKTKQKYRHTEMNLYTCITIYNYITCIMCSKKQCRRIFLFLGCPSCYAAQTVSWMGKVQRKWRNWMNVPWTQGVTSSPGGQKKSSLSRSSYLKIEW